MSTIISSRNTDSLNLGNILETLLHNFIVLNNYNDTSPIANQTSVDNQTDCSPILFNLGKWSTEKEPKLEFGLCPDSIITPIFSSLFLACFLGISLVALMGMIWKRKHGYIEARNPIYMFMTIVPAFIFIVGNTLRFIIGRKNFPCAIYTVLFFVLPPLVSLPTILRCLRLFFMYKLNLQKTKLFELSNMTKSNVGLSQGGVDQSSSSAGGGVSQGNSQTTLLDPQQPQHNETILETSSSEKQIFGNEDLIHRRSNITDIINTINDPDNNKAIPIEMTKFTTTADVKTMDTNTNNSHDLSPSSNHSNNHNNNNNTSNNNGSEQELLDSRIFKNIDSLFDETVTETDDSDSASDFDGRSTWGFKDLTDLRGEIRKFKIFTFFSSYKFVIILYTVVLIFQIALWLILGGVEEAIFSGSSTGGQQQERIFLLEGGMLVFDRGCSMSTKMVLIIAGESVLYIIFEIVSLILCIRSDRDTWGVKKEAILVIVLQVIGVIAFAVTGLIDPIVTLTDYFIPYGYSLMSFSMAEVLIAALLPSVYAIVADYKAFKKIYQESFDSDLEKALHNKKAFNKILDYARRSYAPESVLCFRDIQRFKKMRAGNRKKMAQHIITSYLTIGSPLELNIDNIVLRKNEYSDRINNTNEKIPRSTFNLIQDHCLVDMRDIFDRLKSSDKEISQMIQEWKLKESSKLNQSIVV